MPDTLELPGVRRAIVPLVSAGYALVHELVTHWLPGLPAVVGALDQLTEPSAALRGIHPIRVSRRSFDVVHLPARKMGATDVPPFALSVRGQDERALACANQYSYSAHLLSPWCASCSEDKSAGSPSTSITGRISTVPFRAAGIRAAMPIASSRSWALMRK